MTGATGKTYRWRLVTLETRIPTQRSEPFAVANGSFYSTQECYFLWLSGPELLPSVVSGEIHWLPQMVLWVDVSGYVECWDPLATANGSVGGRLGGVECGDPLITANGSVGGRLRMG